MIVLSVFDGMSCGQIAFEKAGIPIYKYYASELDKYAIQVTQHNYPETIQLGDVVKLRRYLEKPELYDRMLKTSFVEEGNKKLIGFCEELHLLGVDVLIGGSPCQGFSYAGKRLNFKDPRSALFFEFVRIKEILKPTYFLLENVRMKHEYRDIISKYLGVKPIEINSNLVSAQNRGRLYWSNIEGVEQPKDKKIFLNNILQPESEIEEKYYLQGKQLKWWDKNKEFQLKKKYSQVNGSKAICQTARQYANWNGQFIGYSLQEVRSEEAKKERRETGTHKFRQKDLRIREDGKVAALQTSLTRGHNLITFKRSDLEKKHIEKLLKESISRSVVISFQKNGNIRPHREDKKKSGVSEMGTVSIPENKTPTITASHVPKIYLDYRIRKLTPIECERLQTVPDNFTSSVSNTQRYKMLGNGMTVDAVEHHLKNIKI